MYESGEAAKGLAALEKASRLAPDNANILTDLAVAYLSSLNIDKAREYAERAVNMDPTNPMAQDVREKVLGFSKEFSQLDKRVAKIRGKPSNHADTHFTHRFKVSLRDKPDIWRIIDIKGNQMLSSLHKAIFKAFDRFEEHKYSFFLSNKPYDRESEYTYRVWILPEQVNWPLVSGLTVLPCMADRNIFIFLTMAMNGGTMLS